MSIRIGLIGSGIDTSLSPALHTAEAAAHGIEGYRYELLDLTPDADPVAALHAAVSDGFVGFNVTHPFKQRVMVALDEISDGAATVGAVNTILARGSQLLGHNTDRAGFGAALASGVTTAETKRVVQVGAGGAGSAVAFALAESGIGEIDIVDVDAGRATELARRVQACAPGLTVRGNAIADLASLIPQADGVVNATPVGMVGHLGLPVPLSALTPAHWVADIIYRPLRTELIRAAEQLGCQVLDGGQMLVAQAAASFDLFTGMHADLSRMRAHLAQLVTSDDVAA